MQAQQEVTVWATDQQPNHIYLMDGHRAVAYIPFGQGQAQYFSRPIRLDLRGRRFKPASLELFATKPVVTTRVVVKGSKGTDYFVDTEDQTCTCPGFQFRGRCRHLDEVLGEKKS